MSKITVIGAGSVGATIANDLMIQGTASEIVLVDINKQRRSARRWTSIRARRSARLPSSAPVNMKTLRIRIS